MNNIRSIAVYTFLLSFFLFFNSCQKEQQDEVIGIYDLEVEGLKNTTKAEMLLIGEPGDYFGRISFFSKRTRVYEIGMVHKTPDSMSFVLPGKGGYLRLKKNDSIWNGDFKYFGIQAKLNGKRTELPSDEYQDLLALKPLGRGIVSTDLEESFPCYDSETSVLYFTRENKIYSSKANGKEWTEPQLLPFSTEYNNSAPYLSNDGNYMIFTSNRPVENSDFKKKNLWKVSREMNSWAVPEVLPEPINIDSLGDYHAAISGRGHIYFVSYNRKGGFGRSDLYKAVEDDNEQYEVTNLGSSINSENSEADIYVSPDESFILFASTDREDSFGADDIYISYKEGNTWGKPINLGQKVNSYAYEYGAWIDRENEYLYFNSYRRGTSDIYRIELSSLEIFNRTKSE